MFLFYLSKVITVVHTDNKPIIKYDLYFAQNLVPAHTPAMRIFRTIIIILQLIIIVFIYHYYYLFFRICYNLS